MLGSLLAASAAAHPLAPSLLSLTARGDGQFDATWKTPARLPQAARVEPELPERCHLVSPPRRAREGTGVTTRWTVDCGPGGLAGARVGVRGLVARGAGAVVRVELADGQRVQALVDAARPHVLVPVRASSVAVLADYAGLGVEHLVFGLDHVLFVLGLLLLVRGRRALLLTVTAFTLGHSVTLSIVALGWAAPPSTWVEVAIAATLVCLALELVPRPGVASLFGARPWRMAGAFGLLHGLGFAGALSEIGLPHGEIPLALLSFNLGIEIGQLGIVAVALALASLGWRLVPRAPHALRWAAAYGVGCLSAYWLVERTAAALARL
ncbi:MAG: HupE/UreJ family protein [Myxococcota bacterium]|nr:HupE/UreJ family protein [Myxococcota bacterium]